MPKIYNPAEIKKDAKELVREAIRKLKPGQSMVARELAEENGLTIDVMRVAIPAGYRTLGRVGNYKQKQILITCPASSQPPRPKSRK